MVFRNPDDGAIRDILAKPRRIAVVGCSADPYSHSHRIAALLIEKGHDVVPVNPKAHEILARACYGSLREIPGDIDMVDLFRRSEYVADIVEQAIDKRAKIVWTQLGVSDEHAAERAEAAGLRVVMNRCPAIEYRRLF